MLLGIEYSQNAEHRDCLPYIQLIAGDCTEFHIYCKHGNFCLGLIFAFFVILPSSQKFPPLENKTHIALLRK